MSLLVLGSAALGSVVLSGGYFAYQYYFGEASLDYERLGIALLDKLLALDDGHPFFLREGLFRTSGSASRLRELEGALRAAGDPATELCARLDDTDARDELACGFLKRCVQVVAPHSSPFYLRDVAEFAENWGEDEKAEWVRRTRDSGGFFGQLVALLRRVAQHIDQNRMGAGNLAVVFAPSFFLEISNENIHLLPVATQMIELLLSLD